MDSNDIDERLKKLEQEKQKIDDITSILKSNKGLILKVAGGIFGIISATVGFGFNFILHKMNETDTTIHKLQLDISEFKGVTSTFSQLNRKVENLEKQLKCTGSIIEPTDQRQVSGNIEIKGRINACANKKIWLVVSPNDKDCYVQGEVNKKDGSFEKETTSIVNKQKYNIYLLAIDDQVINNNLTIASKKPTPQLFCTDANLGENQLAMITVDNR